MKKAVPGKELNSEEEIKMLTTAAKKRKEAIEQFRNAGREDLASKEETELKIIMEYLPKQLSENEILEEVKKIGNEIGAKTKEIFQSLCLRR